MYLCAYFREFDYAEESYRIFHETTMNLQHLRVHLAQQLARYPRHLLVRKKTDAARNQLPRIAAPV